MKLEDHDVVVVTQKDASSKAEGMIVGRGWRDRPTPLRRLAEAGWKHETDSSPSAAISLLPETQHGFVC